MVHTRKLRTHEQQHKKLYYRHAGHDVLCEHAKTAYSAKRIQYTDKIK